VRQVGIDRKLHLQGFSDKSFYSDKMNGSPGCFSEVTVNANKYILIGVIMLFQRMEDNGIVRQVYVYSPGGIILTLM